MMTLQGCFLWYFRLTHDLLKCRVPQSLSQKTLVMAATKYRPELGELLLNRSYF